MKKKLFEKLKKREPHSLDTDELEMLIIEYKRVIPLAKHGVVKRNFQDAIEACEEVIRLRG